MNSFETDAGFRIWSRDTSIKTRSVIHLSDAEVNPFTAYVFGKDVAERVHGALKKNPHPAIPTYLLRVLRVTQDGGYVYALAFKRGVNSLEEILPANGHNMLYDGIWLTDIYKKFLVDALNITGYFINTEVTVSLHPVDIYFSDNQLKFAGFTLREGGASFEDFKNVHAMITYIEGVTHEVHDELKVLKETLNSPDSRKLNNIYSLPVFWSVEQRVDFPRIIWDAVVNANHEICRAGNIFGKKLSGIMTHPVLGQWHHYYANTTQVYPGTITAAIISKHPYLRKADERDGRECLSFTAMCLSHFTEYKTARPYLPGQNVIELARCFETEFPGYIWKLYDVGKVVELNRTADRRHLNLLPREPLLQNLVSGEDD